MHYTDNALADFDRHQADEEAWLMSRPVCAECGEHIAEETAYYIGGAWVCIECIERFRQEVMSE